VLDIPAGDLAEIGFRNYRYVVGEDRQEIRFDADDDGFEGSEIEAVMPLHASSSAPLCRYFDTFKGIRVYWRAAGSPDGSGDPGQVYLDHLTMTVELEDDPAPEPYAPAHTTWGLALAVLSLAALVAYRMSRGRKVAGAT
jgi:hypothetical protein